MTAPQSPQFWCDGTGPFISEDRQAVIAARHRYWLPPQWVVCRCGKGQTCPNERPRHRPDTTGAYALQIAAMEAQRRRELAGHAAALAESG